jgi:hypothetical protein
LISAANLTENEQNDDIADQDAEEDQLVQNAQEEIERRLMSVGEGYPFRIDDKGMALCFVTPLTNVGVIYLFCLYLTQVGDHTIVKKADAPSISNKVRDLFQACSTVAAGGYVGGPAISFGWPRPKGSSFLQALKAVYKEFGDGKPHASPRPGASRAVKDNGIDIIAWRRQADIRIGGTRLGADELRAGLLASLNSTGHKFKLQEYKQSDIKNGQKRIFSAGPSKAGIEHDFRFQMA